MDFSRSAAPQAAPAASPVAKKSRRDDNDGKLSRVAVVIAAALVALLLVAVAFAVSSGKGDNEDKFVNADKLQAVFLNTGQVYFGKITELNSKYFVVTNIYYLQTSSNGTSTTAAAANTSVSLVKLGCELHEPYDKMVINRDQVTFWENLQGDGQVAKAVATFQKQNPSGQKCSAQGTSTSGSTTNNVQNAGTANTGATGTTTPKQ
jgi:hypothetical protein